MCLLCRTPAGQEDILFQLTDASWSWLKDCTAELSESEELLVDCSVLVKDFADHQLARIPESCCSNFYMAVVTLLSSYSSHLKTPANSSTSSAKENESFAQGSCLLILDILNNLSIKEFIFTEQEVQSLLSYSNLQDLPAVLLFGLQIIVPVISLEFIRTSPALADKYLSFLSFVSGSHVERLFGWLNSMPEETGIKYVQAIMEQLMEGSVLMDGNSARMALQVIINKIDRNRRKTR